MQIFGLKNLPSPSMIVYLRNRFTARFEISDFYKLFPSFSDKKPLPGPLP